ncbi:MAG TPA: asparagine synthase (glutamine-hydrolyzing) [Allosphingosinicella sp.]|jgi:asparagine synthase (glutamine-hydrolysing)|nr:asparagine synthase (glutamine-hydrolyzing) [Allosphingosinicella sp.]
MCGIAGYIGGRFDQGGQGARAVLARMTGAIAYRGPDSAGAWLEPEHKVALGHRRLAILDLSPAGEQPMTSPSGRYVTVYNGEIYNHLELRERLAGPWRGHSDTETLLAAIEAWGLEKALNECAGMFALALWDRQEKLLVLARDRLGEKPLYYGWQGTGAESAFLFGSELKALARHPAFRREIDRRALALFTRFNYVPAPHSIYSGIAKLPPGSFLTLRAGDKAPVVRPYWSAAEVAASGASAPLDIGPEEATDELERLLSKTVSQQMISDVPLGAFLSGGVDSSTVVALMQAQSSRPVKSFSIGFSDPAYNEAEHAGAVARHLGTDHTELYVQPEDALAVIPSLPSIYDEPFADASQIPTLLVSRLARKQVTVALSGDGGDELFAGYNRYRLAARNWGRIAKLPRPLRSAVARGLIAFSPEQWNKVAGAFAPILPRSLRVSLPGEKVHKAALGLASGSADELYQGLVSSWRDPGEIVIGGAEPATLGSETLDRLDGLGICERMMALDMLTYLPDDILAKVDRAAMSVSLETRVPLLDHRVVEFAWRLPLDLKLRGGETKWVLRQLLYRHVPRTLIERPKMGFGIPIDAWLRGPLKGWAEELISERRLAGEGYFRPGPIRAAWDAHQSGRANRQYQIWAILMFQSWLEGQSAPEEAEGLAA